MHLRTDGIGRPSRGTCRAGSHLPSLGLLHHSDRPPNRCNRTSDRTLVLAGCSSGPTIMVPDDSAWRVTSWGRTIDAPSWLDLPRAPPAIDTCGSTRRRARSAGPRCRGLSVESLLLLLRFHPGSAEVSFFIARACAWR